jgi:hypothetical protein
MEEKEEKEVKEVKEVDEVKERRDWLDQRGCTPCFWDKSADDIGRAGDRPDTENERVRK